VVANRLDTISGFRGVFTSNSQQCLLAGSGGDTPAQLTAIFSHVADLFWRARCGPYSAFEFTSPDCIFPTNNSTVSASGIAWLGVTLL
jgi:hypothetical protein